jgi:CheY-like chemotaxis protein
MDRVRQIWPRVVIVDAAMPSLTGPDVASMIRSDPVTSSIRTVLLWPDRSDHDHAGDHAAGIDACVVKPIDPGELVLIVRRLAGRD